MTDKTLRRVLEDAIWQALAAEQGMPHSGVDADYVIPDVIARLKADRYVLVKLPEPADTDVDDEDRPKRAGDYLKRNDTRSEVWLEGLPGEPPYVFFGPRHLGPSYMPAEYARDVAAALLAAAEDVEEDQ